jgi:hypothetical protein
MGNPFRDVYDAIWTLLEAEQDFIDVFPTELQRVKYNAAYPWDSATGQTADSPTPPAKYAKCRVAWKGILDRPEDSSNGSTCVGTFTIDIATSSELQGIIMDATWAVMKAMSNWRSIQAAVTWNGSYVAIGVSSRAVKIDESEARSALAKGHWLSLWQMEVTFGFQTSALQGVHDDVSIATES